mgnify:CR=1 FL=1
MLAINKCQMLDIKNSSLDKSSKITVKKAYKFINNRAKRKYKRKGGYFGFKNGKSGYY